MTALPLIDRDAKPPQSGGALPGILEAPAEELRAWLAVRNQPPMRIPQIRRQVLVNGVTSFADMSDLPKDLRAELAANFAVLATRVERHLMAVDQTHKLVLRLHDDSMVECVLIQDDGRATACVSTQVGCGMGCVFCASGLNGVVRNLTAGEILEQLVRLRNCVQGECTWGAEGKDPSPRAPLPEGEGRLPAPLPEGEGRLPAPLPEGEGRLPAPLPEGEGRLPAPLPEGEGRLPPSHAMEGGNSSSTSRLTHIVVMGMGEPLANLEALLEALAVAGDKKGLGIGARHITISTVGLPAKIRKLADLGKQYHLAVSLHAPNDSLRTRIVPTNDKTGVSAILDAAGYFYEKTGRQVTYEYVVLGGLNDRPDHARDLARLLAGRKAHVNLIPWNEVEGLPYHRPADNDLAGFIDTLRRAGVSVKVRKRKGSEIDAACGQLRRKFEEEPGLLVAEPSAS